MRRILKPDDDRESWGFLSVDFGDGDKYGMGPKVKGWCICYGNREKITRAESGRLGDEGEILAELDEEIKYSRDNGVLLVVFNRSTLKKLRTLFLRHNGGLGVGMKEARFLSLADLLSDHFEGFESPDLDDVCDRLSISVKADEVDGLLNPLLPSKGKSQEVTAIRSLKLRRLFLRVGRLVDSNAYNKV